VTRGSTVSRRLAGTAAGLLLDRVWGEPPSAVHPVAWFGRTMGSLERAVWRDSTLVGAGYAGVGLGLGAVVGKLVRSTAATTWIVVAGRQLRDVAGSVTATARTDPATARSELRALVGRDTSQLDRSGIAAAAIESVAENTVDAVFAPAMWAAVAGAGGAGAYRAVNTLDAMVGHRSPRYAKFGTVAARADDLANWLPARLFAISVAGVRPRRAGRIWRTVRRDAGAHPSPNAGVAEAAMAAALGVELGGPLRYGNRDEERPRLGTGPRPTLDDVAAAIRVADHAERLLVGLVLGGAFAASRLRRSRTS
jgi:adenosylcobinamide-phosphate synthase